MCHRWGASAHPRTRIVCIHGCWPSAGEIIAVAYKHRNVFISPDQYMFMPGGRAYVEAMQNEGLSRQFLFASNYPFTPVDHMVRRYEELDLGSRQFRNVMSDNARRLLEL